MNPVIDEVGSKRWYDDDGEFHREDGPAVEFYDDGDKGWFNHGKLHREDGPAIEFQGGTKAWYLDGERVPCKDNDEFLRLVKNRSLLNLL
jgi:hypothetical protein